jgi:DNA-binding FrmR family transcriptional regulator/tetrahydromethanopterin S-methyltransferase subunit B
LGTSTISKSLSHIDMAFDAAKKGTGRPAGRSGKSSAGGAFDAALTPSNRPATTSSANAPRISANNTFGSSSSSSTGVSTSYQGADSGFATLCIDLDRDLKKITTIISATRKQIDQIGGKLDSVDLRKKIDANLHKGRELSKSVGNLLKDFNGYVSSPDLPTKDVNTRKLQYSKYQKEYKENVNTFTEVANNAVVTMKRFPEPPASSKSSNVATGAGGGKKGGQQDEESAGFLAQLQEMDLNESLINEREAAVDDIMSSMSEVNEAFRDLAQIVEEQGHSIDIMENNVTDAVDSTEKGIDNLNQAASYQKKYGRWIIVLVIILVLVIAGVLGFYFATKK